MSKIEIKVNEDTIPFKDVFQEISKKEYSAETIMNSRVIFFDKTEDLVRFANFVHQYKK